jgi:hypothetical protein
MRWCVVKVLCNCPKPRIPKAARSSTIDIPGMLRGTLVAGTINLPTSCSTLRLF